MRKERVALGEREKSVCVKSRTKSLNRVWLSKLIQRCVKQLRLEILMIKIMS